MKCINSRLAILLLLSISLAPRWSTAADTEERKVKIQELEKQPPSKEALDRKNRSITFLREKKVPILESLPVINDSTSAHLRTTKEIAERVVACTICAVAGETGEKALSNDLVTKFHASELLTPKETEFLQTGISNERERMQFSWQYERSWVLLWALGYVEHLDYPPAVCDVSKLVKVLRGKSVAELVRDAKPRTAQEILDAADLIYRLDWAVVNDRVHHTTPVPGDVVAGVVLERHKALNWLIGYMGEAWDDISNDT